VALQPKFDIHFAADYDSLTFQELTSTYDASTNTGGWGSPNPDPSGTTPATTGYLTVTHEWDGVTLDDITIVPSNVIADTTLALTSFESSSTDYFSTKFTDGVYTFVYTVTVTSVDYTYTVKKLVTADLWCQLMTLAKKFIDGTCPCAMSSFKDKWLVGFSKLMALQGEEICGDTTQAKAMYTSLSNYLTSLKCNC
jgi:hypothetical protein